MEKSLISKFKEMADDVVKELDNSDLDENLLRKIQELLDFNKNNRDEIIREIHSLNVSRKEKNEND